MNILYICAPDSFIERKWLLWLARNTEHQLYLITHRENHQKLGSTDRKTLEEAGIRILPPLPAFSIFKPWERIKGQKRLRKYLKQEKIDILHVMFLTPYALWAKRVDVPVIMTARGSDVFIVAQKLKDGTGIRGLHNRLLFRMLANAVESSCVLTATSHRLSSQIKELFPGAPEAEIIRTGIDIEAIDKCAIHTQNESGKPYIFFPRHIYPTYQTLEQIEAIGKLPEKIIERYRFLFTEGLFIDGAYLLKVKTGLQKLADEKALDYKILPRLEQKEMWQMLKQARLAVMTPKSDGTPSTMLECMALGTPHLISDLELDQELFGGTCPRLPCNDFGKLPGLIEKALEDYPEEMLKLAREKAERYGSQKREMKKIVGLYHNFSK